MKNLNFRNSNEKEIEELEAIKAELINITGYDSVIKEIEDNISYLYKTSIIIGLKVSSNYFYDRYF